jgi:hypothetical protein
VLTQPLRVATRVGRVVRLRCAAWLRRGLAANGRQRSHGAPSRKQRRARREQYWLGRSLLIRRRGGLPRRDATRGLLDGFRRHACGGDVAQFQQAFAVVGERRLPGGDREPQIRHRVVARHAGPIEVHLAELVLGPQVIAIRRAAIPLRRRSRIRRNATPFAIEIANRALRGGVTMLRRLAIPRQRLRIVLRDAKSKVVQLTYLKFGRCVSLIRGFAKPLDALRGVASGVIQKRAERELRDRITGGGASARRSERTIDVRFHHEHRRCEEHYAHRLRIIAVALLLAPTTFAQTAPPPDVVYIPTPQPVVEAMLEAANVKESDVVYDLGSGDGRIVITAAKKHGARGVGIEIDPGLVKKASENAAAAGVADRVRFVSQNLFEADIRDATVVTLYLLQSLNEKLRPKLVRELKPGTRVVSHLFNMGPEWPPQKTLTVGASRIYVWTVE